MRRELNVLFFLFMAGCQGFFSEKQWSSGCSYILPCTEKEGSGVGIVQVGRTDMILHLPMIYKCDRIHIQSSQFLPLPLKKISYVRLLKTYDGFVVFLFWIHNFILSRSQKNAKMTDFFHNNFSEDRWRKAALKNAFSLLGKQRFQHSAAFFLLAGSLKDAVEASGNQTWHSVCKKALFPSAAVATLPAC